MKTGIKDGVYGELTDNTTEENHKEFLVKDKNYSTTKGKTDGRYKNILSHMRLLWHSDEGSDGCRKCTEYERILVEAFDNICSMSGRGDMLSEDFCHYHRDDITELNGQPRDERELDMKFGLEDSRTYKKIAENSTALADKTIKVNEKLVEYAKGLNEKIKTQNDRITFLQSELFKNKENK